MGSANQMISDLYLKPIYLMNIEFLISTFIREYDISQANINVLLQNNLISQDYYDKLRSLPKLQREITIGCLLRDTPGLSEKLKAGIIDARKVLFESNNIQEHEVLSIKNDAVYIIGRELKYTEFGSISFLNKNTYTSFYKLGNKEIYYMNDMVSGLQGIDVKGIKDEQLIIHQNYFLSFLMEVFRLAEVGDIRVLIKYIQDFYLDYINYRLNSPEFYRRFDAESYFELIGTPYSIYRSDIVSNSSITLNELNISYNANIIRSIYKIFTSLYISQINKNKRRM